jgi:release factor glutamine methyltransferase
LIEAQTVTSLISEFRCRLADAGIEEGLREARLLISHVSGLSPLDIITQPSSEVSAEAIETAKMMLERRLKGESIHRIIGRREFFSLDLEISKETLEPRPDTEILVEALLPVLRDMELSRAPRILDLGTGTGAICLSLLASSRVATGVGVDISEDALSTSLRNAAAHGLAERYQALKSSWFDEVEGKFDIIVSNPPYIRSDVIPTLDVIVRGFDPMAALDGGPDGLEPYRVIADQAHLYLSEEGAVGLEIGYDQKEDVCAIFAGKGFNLRESLRDYGGNDRVLLFTLAAKNL